MLAPPKTICLKRLHDQHHVGPRLRPCPKVREVFCRSGSTHSTIVWSDKVTKGNFYQCTVYIYYILLIANKLCGNCLCYKFKVIKACSRVSFLAVLHACSVTFLELQLVLYVFLLDQ